MWLPAGPYATVAGLVLQRLGRIPTGGETVEVEGCRLEVLAVQHRAITRLRLIPPGQHPNGDKDPASA